MLHVRVRGGGTGRYHSRVVMLPPRPAGAGTAAGAVSGAPPPIVRGRVVGAARAEAPGRSHSRVVRLPPRRAGAGTAAGTVSGAPPPIVRRIVLAPPLPKVSYMRSMPLWLELMYPR